MDTGFDRRTEGRREKRLMARVRGGGLAETDLEQAMLPFPVKMQIQTVSPCNAACVMCPWEETRDVLPQGRMSDDVYAAVLEQMRGRGVERVGLFLMNEPTLDVHLPERTAQLKAVASESTALIFTNGLKLTADRAQALADAGMDEVTVSVVGFDKPDFERLMVGIDYDTVMRNLHEIGARARAGRFGRMRVSIVGLEFPGEAAKAAAFSARTGLPVEIKQVTNRAGMVDLDGIGVHNAHAPAISACQRPFVKAYVLYNGDLVLCNCDWMRSTIIGNVMRDPIDVLWRGEQMMAIRRQHLRRSFDPACLCARCDYPYLP